MPEEWRLIFAPAAHAFMNMAIDEAIAKSSAESKPAIRFYTWEKPAVSIGYFQRIMPVLNWLKRNPPIPPFSKGGEGGIMDIVRRPTGGGVVLHGPDLTYSIVIKTQVSTRNLIPFFYRQIGQAIIEGIRFLGINAGFCTKSRLSTQDSRLRTSLSLCAQTPVEFDVLVEGIKVAGCAARRFQETLLFQGYISIGQITKMASQQVIDVMVKGFALALDIELVKENLTDDEIALAKELNKNKYSRNEWNYKR